MRRIQIGIVGGQREGVLQVGAAVLKRGAVVLTVDSPAGRELKQLGKDVVCLGGGEDYPIRVETGSREMGMLLLVESADMIITVGEGDMVELARALARSSNKGVVSGERAVERAFEKLVRYNLFGSR